MVLAALSLVVLVLTTADTRGLGWEQCGHGLTAGPREVAEVGFLDDLLVLPWYPAHSGAELVAGILRLRHSQVSFAGEKPTWSVSHGRGGVAALLTPPPEEGISGDVLPDASGACRDVSGEGAGRREEGERRSCWRIQEEDWTHQENSSFSNSAFWASGAANPSALEASSCARGFFWEVSCQKEATGIFLGRTSWDWLRFLGLGCTVPGLQVVHVESDACRVRVRDMCG